MATINNVKDFIYEFTRQYHFDQMPPEVRARYDDYAANSDFAGNMRFWHRDLEGKPLPLLHNSKLEKIYDLFQDVFENMAKNHDKFKETKATNNFFNQWYGPGKVFNLSKPAAGVEARIEHFKQRVLDKSPAIRVKMASILKRNLPYYIHLPDDFDYDDFVKDVEDKKYLTDPDKRKILFAVIDYTQANSGSPDLKDWPQEVGEYDFTKDNYKDPGTGVVDGGLNVLDADTSKWFSTQYNVGFQFALPVLLKELIDNQQIRKDFSTYDKNGGGVISSKIQEGIDKTNYADNNPENKDYVPPKYNDQKNFWGRVDEKLEKIKENNIDPWANVLRGTRRFFTPHAKTVIEACSKVKTKDGKKLKPTDGLQGILDCKDAILKKVEEKSKTAHGHFKWFAERLKDYSTNMPDAFKGAFKNPKQMRAIVEQIIYDALDTKGGAQDDAVAKAKTALEILSTMKYGMMHSRTMDALKDGLKDQKWLSDDKLSWNKYEGVKFVTSAFDKTAKFAALGLGRGLAALRNKYFRDHTKLRGKFRAGSEVQKAHQKFVAKNTHDKRRMEIHSRNMFNRLGAGRGESGLVINDASLAAVEAQLGLREGTLAARQADLSAKETDFAQKEKILAEKNQAFAMADADFTQKENILNAMIAAGYPAGDPELVMAQNARDAALVDRNNAEVERNNAEVDRNNAEADRNVAQAAVGPAEHDRDVLLRDVQRFKQATDEKDKLDHWNENHPDKYLELMAYWDMLESFGKSHQFTLAADVMRKKFLKKNAVTGKSKAETITADFLTKYQRRYAA